MKLFSLAKFFWRVLIIALNFSVGMTGIVDYTNYDDMKYAVS